MEEIKYKKPSEEMARVKQGDARLDARLVESVEAMSAKSEASIIGSCGTYGAKGFYGLLSNEKFKFNEIQKASGEATGERIETSGIEEVLLVQDTMDMNMKGHEKTAGLGYSSDKTKGIKVHSCLAMAPDGTNLGLASQSYKTRAEAKNEASKEEKQRRSIEDKESNRWLETGREAMKIVPENVTAIHVCDREGDFYELYAETLTLESKFVIRVSQDRATVDGDNTMQQIRRTAACGVADITIPRDTRKNVAAQTIEMEIAYCAATIARPKRVTQDAPKQLTLNLVRITEITLADDPIEWILATNMPLENSDDALKIVTFYTHRWKIERFHFILKSGCKVEKIQQRSYSRILPVLFIYSIIAAFILSITYFARNSPSTPCDSFLSEIEWKTLYRLVNRSPKPPIRPYSIASAVAFLGELGSFKHKPSDGDYGVLSVWKGLFRLFDALDTIDRLMGQV